MAPDKYDALFKLITVGFDGVDKRFDGVEDRIKNLEIQEHEDIVHRVRIKTIYKTLAILATMAVTGCGLIMGVLKLWN